MRSDLLPLSRSTIDRDGSARRDPRLLERLLADQATRAVLVARGQVATTRGGGLHLAEPARLPPGGGDPEGAVLAYLGRDDARGYLGWLTEDDPPALAVTGDGGWASLREIGGDLADRDAGLAVAAVALASWHARHTHCPVCGDPTLPQEAGWTRRCPTDGSVHHPRTDPAVIVVVTDGQDRLLLAHAAHWPPRRFSLVAGYVEPGEPLEAAVRREVAEECGLAVEDLVYQGSQPWPFPASLMVGFTARVIGGELRVDGDELTDALFVSRADLATMVAAADLVLPGRSSIARVLIEQWYGAPLPVT